MRSPADSYAVDVAVPADYPEQTARASIEAAEAGAAVVHLHARDPETGFPSQDPVVRTVLPQIKRESDVVINLTTGGSPTMTVEERIEPAMRFSPEVASLNMGLMNPWAAMNCCSDIKNSNTTGKNATWRTVRSAFSATPQRYRPSQSLCL